MAVWLNVFDMLDGLEDDDFGLPEEEDSDSEGEGIQGYLPEVAMSVLEEEEEEEFNDTDRQC